MKITNPPWTWITTRYTMGNKTNFVLLQLDKQNLKAGIKHHGEGDEEEIGKDLIRVTASLTENRCWARI